MTEPLFTADLHIGHANIIGFQPRPFRDVEHMTEELVARWNVVVAPAQDIYILGDFFWRAAGYALPILDRLHGRKYLVRGNHDRACVQNKAFAERFEWIKDLAEIKVADPDAPGGQQRIVLCHYPMQVWNMSHHGAWQLHGHSHGSAWQPWPMKRCDVGVDCWDYAPVSYAALKRKLTPLPTSVGDGHGLVRQ